MTLIHKNGYYIDKSTIDTECIESIKKDLTVSPFSYFNKNNNNTIKYKIYEENKTHIIVPKYYGIENFGRTDSNEFNGKKINIKFNGTLRKEQNTIVDKSIDYINTNYGGVLCLPCGAGKTVLSIYLMCHYKIKTLIVVHKTFLLNQWKERINHFTNASIGIIQQNKIDVKDKDVVIAMLQSVSKNKYDNNIFKDFGLVIFDEAHHAPSQYFSKALPIISCKYTLGLSATPERNDRLEKILYWYFGNIIHKEENIKNSNININIVQFDIDHPKFKEVKMYNGEVNRQLVLNKITTIGRRNVVINNIILKLLENKERKIIILSDRVKHLELLKTRLDNYNITTTGFYIGGMKLSELKETENNATVIYATYGMASEGLDIPKLNTLIMATSRRNIEQSIGRITRTKTDINPIVYDIVDQLPIFISQASCRKRYYTKNGYTINLEP